MYTNFLVDVGKLAYLVGSLTDTTNFKKIFEFPDSKSKIFYKCLEDLPPTTFKKIKFQPARKGIIRSDWLHKILDRAPEMIVMIFNCTEELDESQKWEDRLHSILKKINRAVDIFRTTGKDDVIFKLIVVIGKLYTNGVSAVEKITSFLKTYEKELQIIQQDYYAKDLNKLRSQWIPELEKNYEKKFRKIRKRMEESFAERRIGCLFKLAILSETLPKREEKERYIEAYNSLKLKMNQLTRKEFDFQRYVEIRELRTIADVVLLRYVKLKLGSSKEIFTMMFGHVDFFKLRNTNPVEASSFFYYEELQWRCTFLENLLEVLYTNEIVDSLGKVHLAQLVNGLLTYLHQLSELSESHLQGNGKELDEKEEVYFGRRLYEDAYVSDSDIAHSVLMKIIKNKKDFIAKGIQIITRYKKSGLFGSNQINFLNVYLMRFSLGDGRISSLIPVYNEIVKVELNRCNYFLLNELFNEIKNSLQDVDEGSKVTFHATASLICDYFQSKEKVAQNINCFFESLKADQKESHEKSEYVFELKKNSYILTVEVLMTEKILIINEALKVKLKCRVDPSIQQWLGNKSFLRIQFNHPNMVVESTIDPNSFESSTFQQVISIEPLKYITKDATISIDEIRLVMSNHLVAWSLEHHQISFKKYDSVLFCSNIRPPEITLIDLKKTYFLDEFASFSILVEKIEGIHITAKFQVKEDEAGKTEFFEKIEGARNNETNSKKHLLLQESGIENRFWLKLNSTGVKNMKLVFSVSIHKKVKLESDENEQSYKEVFKDILKEINFKVVDLFSVSKTFREAITGQLIPHHQIPINKKIILTFTIQANHQILIHSINHQNNHAKIKYHRNVQIGKFLMSVGEDIKSTIIFEINEDSRNQIDLFLAALCIKWTRNDLQNIENVFLDNEIKISSISEKAMIFFHQRNEVQKRKKSSLSIQVENLTSSKIHVYATMQSTEDLLRIGERAKSISISAYERAEMSFDIFAINAGIFQFPFVKVFVDSIEAKVSAQNYLVYCF